MTAFLPQHDPAPAARQRSLEVGRRHYDWNHSYVSPLALVERIPIQDEWSHRWITMVGRRVFDVLENQILLAGDQSFLTRLRRYSGLFLKKVRYFRLDGRGLRQLVQDAIEHTVVSGRPQSLDDFSRLFRAIQLPPIHREFTDDAVFARMRVAGPNPLVLRRVEEWLDHFPVTQAHFASASPTDSLESALQEGRLYLADYRMMETVECGSVPHGRKYIDAPLALFVVQHDSRKLMPVAIQCRQQPGMDNPIFTPHDGFNWLIAKTIVEIADGNMHEAVSHLARTHLFVEPFVVATGRHLADRHPLKQLLRPHFEGTLAINNMAHRRLINSTGVVDQLLAGTIESTRALAVRGLQDYSFNDILLPDTFATRGVADEELLPDYPYRDDSLLYWDVIRRWVGEYLSIYYPSDEHVRQDWELSSWRDGLVSQEGGRVAAFGEAGGRIASRESLERVVTSLIYTASVQHAAVNFPQYDLMSYCPNMPLAGYRAAPTSAGGGSERDFLDLLPPLDMSELAMKVLYVLGSVHYTTLGKYSESQFDDRRLVGPLNEFQQRLDDIGTIIAERNRNRRPYTCLQPAGIPQSINI